MRDCTQSKRAELYCTLPLNSLTNFLFSTTSNVNDSIDDSRNEAVQEDEAGISNRKRKRNESNEIENLTKTITAIASGKYWSFVLHQSVPLQPANFSFTDLTTEVDADEMFFRSLLPEVRQLNSAEKMKFRMEVMNLLNTALYK